MLAIYKREVKSYFTSMIGYVVITAFLLMLGFYYWGYNLDGQSPNMAYTLSSVSILYIIIIPILTMRSFAEEQRQRTDQLLLWKTNIPVSCLVSLVLAAAGYGTIIYQFIKRKREAKKNG